MTNNEIVTLIHKNDMVKSICSKFKDKIHYNIEDLEQHIYLTLLEMPNKKLNELYTNNELFYYIYYVIKAQATSPKSSFNQLYSNYKIPIDFSVNVTTNITNEYDEQNY